MATGPRYKVPFRRRRDNRTDYYIRKKLLTSGEMRAVVRRSSRNITIQFVKFGMGGDSVVTSATSQELRSIGWTHACSNIPAAYLTGYIAGKKALKAGVTYAVLDIGMQTPAKGAVLFAAVAGMTAAGLEIPHGDGVLPEDYRLFGEHIDEKIAADVEKAIKELGGEKKERKPRPAAKKAEAEPEPEVKQKKKAAEPAADAKQSKKPAAKGSKDSGAKPTKKKGG